MPGTPIIAANFEQATLRETGVAGWQCAPNGVKVVAPDSRTGYAIQLVPADEPPTVGGRRALRLERRPGDNPIGYGDRAQVQWGGRDQQRAGGGILAVRIVMKVERSDPPGGWNVLGWQEHAEASGSPPLGMYRKGNRLSVDANRWGLVGGKAAIVEYGRTLWDIDLSTRFGQWMVIDVAWNQSTSDSEGWVEVHLDGAPQQMRNGQPRYPVRTACPNGIGTYSIVTNYAADGSKASVLHVAFFGVAHGGIFPGQVGEPAPDPGDAVPPVVAIVQPAPSTDHIGTVDVRARVTDDVAVTRVQAGLNVPATAVDLVRVPGTDEYVGRVAVPAGVSGVRWLWVAGEDAAGNRAPSAGLPIRVAPTGIDSTAARVHLATIRDAADRLEGLLP